MHKNIYETLKERNKEKAQQVSLELLSCKHRIHKDTIFQNNLCSGIGKSWKWFNTEKPIKKRMHTHWEASYKTLQGNFYASAWKAEIQRKKPQKKHNCTVLLKNALAVMWSDL